MNLLYTGDEVRGLFPHATYIDHTVWDKVRGLSFDVQQRELKDRRISLFAEGTDRGKDVVIMLMPGGLTLEKVSSFAKSQGFSLQISRDLQPSDLVVPDEPHLLMRRKIVPLPGNPGAYDCLHQDGIHVISLVALIAAVKKSSGETLFAGSTIICREAVAVAGRSWKSSVNVTIQEHAIIIEPSSLFLSPKDVILLALRFPEL